MRQDRRETREVIGRKGTSDYYYTFFGLQTELFTPPFTFPL